MNKHQSHGQEATIKVIQEVELQGEEVPEKGAEEEVVDTTATKIQAIMVPIDMGSKVIHKERSLLGPP